MNILFSIPAYKNPKSLSIQLQSIEKIKHDMTFYYCLHINAKDDIDLFKEHLDKLNFKDKIFYNNYRFPLEWGYALFNVHYLNYIFIKNQNPNLILDKIVLCSATEMYFRGGGLLQNIFNNYEYGLDLIDCKNFYKNQHIYANNFYNYDNNFKLLFDSISHVPKIGAVWEGTFYSIKLYEEMFKHITKYFQLDRMYTLNKLGNLDECLLPSLVCCLTSSIPCNSLIRADHINPNNKWNLNIINDLLNNKNISIIESNDKTISQNTYYCGIKRIDIDDVELREKLLNINN